MASSDVDEHRPPADSETFEPRRPSPAIERPGGHMDPCAYSAALPPGPSSVALARFTLRAALWDWRIDHLADPAQLIISELASNAIKYANNAVVYVYLRSDHGAVLAIEVVDDSCRLPRIMDADLDDESHRGMMLVDAMATEWGVDLLDAGKVTWAHLKYD